MTAKFNEERFRYLNGILTPKRKTRIVDVGANPIERAPYQALLDLGACEVWGFEPQTEAFQTLADAAGPNEYFLREAVGDGAEHELRICKGSGFSSLLEPNRKTFGAIGRFHRGGRVIDRVTVATRCLDDITEVPEFDLLKIDIQGGEKMVFEGAKAKLVRAVAVISEVAAIPLYENQPLLDEQMATLRSLGFGLHKFMSFRQVRMLNKFSGRLSRRDHRSQLTDGDAIFVRSLLSLDELTGEELKHLILLSDSAFGSYDIAVVALTELLRRDLITAGQIDSYIDLVPNAQPSEELAAP